MCEYPLRGGVQFCSSGWVDECVLDSQIKSAKTQIHSCILGFKSSQSSPGWSGWSQITGEVFILAIYYTLCLCIIVPAYNIMHEEGRVEVAAFHSDVRDCVMDDLNSPCSLLHTSVWLFVKFSWTVSLDQCDNARTHVISSQSNLNEGVIYSLTTVFHIPHKGIGFFLAHSSPSAPDLVIKQKYQSSVVYEGKTASAGCDDISPLLSILYVVSTWGKK